MPSCFADSYPFLFAAMCWMSRRISRICIDSTSGTIFFSLLGTAK